MNESNTNWQYETDHELGHQFQEWEDAVSKMDPKRAWQGKDQEWFILWEHYQKARFRDWALLRGLPRERWEAVFNEVMDD